MFYCVEDPVVSQILRLRLRMTKKSLRMTKTSPSVSGKTANSGAEGLMLKFEHLLFEGYSAGGGETADFAVAADYTVARND